MLPDRIAGRQGLLLKDIEKGAFQVAIVEEAQLLSGGQSHQLNLSADPAVVLRGDRTELLSAFSNLIYNAVRHTPPGTRIDVTWAGGADGARFTVRDFGEGIALHHLPRLTERFYRVDPSRARRSGGSGLGLAIVKHVLEHYDAELTIISEIGTGSSFDCVFPGSVVDNKAPPSVDNGRFVQLDAPEMPARSSATTT